MMQDNERKPWQRGGGAPKAIGAYVARMLNPVARARGFATTALLTEWPAVVGDELARFTMPDKVVWPRRGEDRESSSSQSAWRDDGAILVLKVEGPRAIELQHRTEQILQRVNTYFGYRAVAELRFLQAPVSRADNTPYTSPCPVDDAEPLPASAVDDAGLTRALRRLRAGIRGKDPRP
jgi:hypothetical protein